MTFSLVTGAEKRNKNANSSIVWLTNQKPEAAENSQSRVSKMAHLVVTNNNRDEFRSKFKVTGICFNVTNDLNLVKQNINIYCINVYTHI